MSEERYAENRVWCPRCEAYGHLLKVPSAAKLVDVHSRTIYRYIEEGLVYAVKVAGKRYRLCGNCLLKQYDDAG